MTQRNGKKLKDRLSTKWWEAKKDNKETFITSISSPTETSMMKSIFMTREEELPTGFKWLELIFNLEVSASVEPKKALLSSLREFHFCSMLFQNSTNNNLWWFFTTLSEAWTTFQKWSFQVESQIKWLDSQRMVKPRFGLMKTLVWIIQVITLRMPNWTKEVSFQTFCQRLLRELTSMVKSWVQSTHRDLSQTHLVSSEAEEEFRRMCLKPTDSTLFHTWVKGQFQYWTAQLQSCSQYEQWYSQQWLLSTHTSQASHRHIINHGFQEHKPQLKELTEAHQFNSATPQDHQISPTLQLISRPATDTSQSEYEKMPWNECLSNQNDPKTFIFFIWWVSLLLQFISL